jgi:glyoxylase-like metal-dependent hydrolase (beta-lactamase superfamily II)
MLEAMAPHTTTHPIDAAVNTHGNPDHCYGNELLPAHTEIYSTVEAKKDLAAAPPQLLASLEHFSEAPAWAPFVAAAFGPFEFEDISLRLPTTTFEGKLDLRVGDRELSFIELGPAHTNGDAIVHVQDAGVVFTGDILSSRALRSSGPARSPTG